MCGMDALQIHTLKPVGKLLVPSIKRTYLPSTCMSQERNQKKAVKHFDGKKNRYFAMTVCAWYFMTNCDSLGLGVTFALRV